MALPRLDGLLRSGVTSIEVKSGYGLTLDDELKMLRAAKALENHRRIKITTTLLAAHAVPPEYKEQPDSYIDSVCQEIIPKAVEQGLADAVDVFCESIGFNLRTNRTYLQQPKNIGSRLKAIQNSSLIWVAARLQQNTAHSLLTMLSTLMKPESKRWLNQAQLPPCYPALSIF